MKIDLSTYPYSNYLDYKDSFEKIIKTLSYLYTNFYEIEFPNDITIKYENSNISPRCNRVEKIIYFNCDIQYWCQLVYQLSHELCHYQIPNDVPQNLRWFEETICECASFHFLYKFYELWKQIEIYPGYCKNFKKYADNQMIMYKSFDLKQLSISNSKIIQSLINDEYQREINKYIAFNIFPIFKKDINFWKNVKYLCYLSPNKSFVDVLEEWKSFDSSSIGSINSILELIGARSLVTQ